MLNALERILVGFIGLCFILIAIVIFVANIFCGCCTDIKDDIKKLKKKK